MSDFAAVDHQKARTLLDAYDDGVRQGVWRERTRISCLRGPRVVTPKTLPVDPEEAYRRGYLAGLRAMRDHIEKG